MIACYTNIHFVQMSFTDYECLRGRFLTYSGHFTIFFTQESKNQTLHSNNLLPTNF